MASPLQKKWRQTAAALATEPGLAMIGAHVLLSVAAGGAALAIASTTFLAATSIKILKETGLVDKIKSGRRRAFIKHVNAPLRIAGGGLAAMSAISFAGGLPLLGFAFAMFSSGNLIFNTPFAKKIPLDNALFTAGSCTTAFIAGGSVLPWFAIIPAGALSIYNLVKPAGNRNLGHPKLWFAAAQASSAALGLVSGQPERLLPALAMLNVTWGYSMMEARASGWFDKDREKSALPDSTGGTGYASGTGPAPGPKPAPENPAGKMPTMRRPQSDFTEAHNPEPPQNPPPPSPAHKNMPGAGPDMS